MISPHTQPPPQFNSYKYLNFLSKLEPYIQDKSPRFVAQAQKLLQDCCWCRNMAELAVKWSQPEVDPSQPQAGLSLLHYNIRNFYSNQTELVEMISSHSPSIVSLNEMGTVVPINTIKRLLFSYHVYSSEGTNSHGGAILAIDKRIKHTPIVSQNRNMIAVEVPIGPRQFVVASIYSPPTEQLPLREMTELFDRSRNIILAGDFNAKHPEWGCPQVNTKGRVLEEWLETQGLKVLNAGVRTSLRSNTTIDLIISNEEPDASESKTLAYVGSDHLPVLTQFHQLRVKQDKCLVARTNWKLYTIILAIIQVQADDELRWTTPNGEITFQWFIALEQVMANLKSQVTEWAEVPHKRPSIPPALRTLLRHKHYLQNRFRRSRTEEDRLRLRSWSYLVRWEFRDHRQRQWDQFIANMASPNAKNFWATVKKLNRKKSVDFTALSSDQAIHHKPAEIIERLETHFTERHGPPAYDPSDPLMAEARRTWNTVKNASDDEIMLLTSKSDLHYEVKEVGEAIRRLKPKNSSSFDKVSNSMIKLLPATYHKTLTLAYNNLFLAGHWGKEWKAARTICLNKSDNPAPTTDQLRPISLLPTFSKVFERLFLLRFKAWSDRKNVLPAQQSGARSHQSTLSRVNALIEQVSQSHQFNTFTPVIYIDFQQAFDKLWQEGLILKLSRLDCPFAYLIWIINYFTDRTLKIEHGACISGPIQVRRGAPQGSCLGPVMYITAHHDMPLLFSNPNEVHAYVDDVAILYTPPILLRRKDQVAEVQRRMNKDMESLSEYAKKWRQPLNVNKTKLVVYHSAVQTPKMLVSYEDTNIEQKKCYKYLGFLLDERLAFKPMIDSQLIKLRKTFPILKYIHRRFPMAMHLKNKFFNAFMWPHLLLFATINVLLSPSAQERIASFYRRCLRLTYSLFECPTDELHQKFLLPTVESRFNQFLRKRLRTIQTFETSLIDTTLQSMSLRNALLSHYRDGTKYARMPIGRPSRRLERYLEHHRPTYVERLVMAAGAAPPP